MQNSSYKVVPTIMRLDLNYCNKSAGSVSNTDMQRLVTSTQNYINRNPKKSRRFRSSFTTEQINYLENEFKRFPYIGNVNRQELAKVLNIPERAIKIWFQNRRMKEKKDVNIVEDRNNTSSMNITNNQLNNVHNLKSTNDQFHTTTSLNVANDNSQYCEISKDVKTSISGNEAVNYVAIDLREQEITTTTDSLENRLSTAKSSSSDLDRDGLCKVPEKCQVKNVRFFKNEGKVVLEGESKQDVVHLQRQDLPEDLSRNSKTTKINELRNNADINKDANCMPVYVPNCYAPSFAPGNVLWNPSNMGHILPAKSTLPTQYHPGPYAVISPQTFRKSNCNCDCHSQFVPQVVPNQSSGQYLPIFTIPYTTPHL